MTPRDIEKLKAIGYTVTDIPPCGNGHWLAESKNNPEWFGYGYPTTDDGIQLDEAQTWALAKAHAQSPGGMKATMADKVRFMVGCEVNAYGHNQWLAETEDAGGNEHEAIRDSPEAAVDALFWTVP